MKTSKQWVQHLQSVKGYRTLSDVALALQTSQPHISRIIAGYNPLSDDIAEKVALLCGVPLPVVLADIQIERAKTEAQRSAWTMISTAMNAMMQSTVKTAPALLLALCVGMGINAPEARANTNNAKTSVYIMSTKLLVIRKELTSVVRLLTSLSHLYARQQ